MARIVALLAAIAAISGAASAVTCTPSETYCGSRLLKIDANNQKAIKSSLAAGKQTADDAHVSQSVFWCVPSGVPAGESGLLFVTYCDPKNACQEGGALGGVGDACSTTSSTTSPKIRR
ncbi:unnamed protein product [Colletotrichum noveboracense]|uniref:Uncharacterized protein n=1 Tax=Colletotrichum noveboracense TaxID=2664923 RepID=A0A9W4RST3_9PEZI|nr:hypothetical protein K456DRAFT_1834760 [Colletotrichum gloeosporioides 23]CAI0646937.1 unnamed protein product [Colletotrichum noveboracense]